MSPVHCTTLYRGRFAPSPTGPLHFGSLVAAVGSYLDARHHNGCWLVRIEDLDPPREKPGAADDILRTLETFGFEWDESVLYQSHREEAYRDSLEQLLTAGSAYPCTCSRREITEAGRPGVEGFIYPGTCRTRPAHVRTRQSIRLRTDNDPLSFVDRIGGQIEQRLASEIGDFVIRRADGLFSYQLAVVVDDGYQNITRVVRGADLLLSTPRQIFLQKKLGLTTPEYAHLPLVLGEDGKKLSKQARANPVERNAPLSALLSAVRFLNQPLPEEEPSDLKHFWAWAIANWQPKKVSRIPRATSSGGSFDVPG